MGYKVEYPYGEKGSNVAVKHIRPGRELACVPASKLPALASAQACRVENFGNRLLYLQSKLRDMNESQS